MNDGPKLSSEDSMERVFLKHMTLKAKNVVIKFKKKIVITCRKA